jgi:rod shape-determining protein MreC
MQNLLKFIQTHSNFLLFLCLEAIAFLLFLSANPFQRSSVLSAANEAAALLNEGADHVSGYFYLGQANRALAEENAQLLAENARLRSFAEAAKEQDSLYQYANLQWRFRPAKVVDMETRTQHNYLVLNKGSRDSIRVGQGVLSHDGVVGVVSSVNSHFALVIPIIHPKMNVSCRLLKSGATGFLHWQGPSSRHALLTDVARHIAVEEGDTVVSSGLTGLFPEGVHVGVIDRATLDDGDTYYTLRVRLATDFRSLQYVQIVENPLKAMQDSLLYHVP